MGVQIAVQLLAPALVVAYGPDRAVHDGYGRAVPSHHVQRERAIPTRPCTASTRSHWGAGTPRLVLANSLIDAFVVRFGLAFLLSGVLGFGYVGIFVAQAKRRP